MKKYSMLLILILGFGMMVTTSNSVVAQDDHHGESYYDCEPTANLNVSNNGLDFDKDEYKVEKNTCYNVFFENTDPIQEHDLNIELESDNEGEEVHIHVDNSTAHVGGPAPGIGHTLMMTPDTDGEFEMWCSVDTHRSSGMEATLIVGEGESGFLDFNIYFAFIAVAFAAVTITRFRKKL